MVNIEKATANALEKAGSALDKMLAKSAVPKPPSNVMKSVSNALKADKNIPPAVKSSAGLQTFASVQGNASAFQGLAKKLNQIRGDSIK